MYTPDLQIGMFDPFTVGGSTPKSIEREDLPMRKLLSRFVATLSVSILIVVAITNLLIMIALHKIMKTVLVKEKAVSDCGRHCKARKEDS